MKEWFNISIGCIGAFIASIYGGWDMSLTTLCICMGVDYLMGLLIAGLFKKSKKSKSGALSSDVCWKGLCKKGITLLIVLIAHRIDLMFDTTYIRDATCIAYIVNELISICENCQVMGIPMPKVITKAIGVLKEDEEKKADKVGKEK